MALEISIKLEKTVLKMQENTVVEVRLRNAGRRALTLADPQFSAEFPIFRTQNRDTGERLTFTRVPSPRVKSEIPLSLEPGAEKEWSFALRRLIRPPQPGAYLLSAEYEYDEGLGRAASETVELVLQPQNVRFFAHAIHQPLEAEPRLFWIEPGPKDAALTRTRIMNYILPEVGPLDFVDRLPTGVEPLPSIHANGTDAGRDWLVWPHQGKLMFRAVGREPGEGKLAAVEMPDAQLRIVPYPLALESGDGEVLLWLSDRSGASAKLQVARLKPNGGSGPGPGALLPDPGPWRWGRTAFLSTARRRAYLVYQRDEQISLQSVSWDDGREMTPPKTLAVQAGRFVAAGFSIQADDRVTGILVVRPAERDDALTFAPWTQHPDGEFAAAEPELAPCSGAAGIERSLVAVNDREEPFVAIRAAGRPWQLRGPAGGFAPVGGEAGLTAGPLELFFNGRGAPLFLYTKPERGFFLGTPAGDPPEPTNT